MTHPVVHESKHILKKVLIGVTTGVVGAAIIYFLGYNKSDNRASDIEIKKNTIKTWKAYVTLENEAQTRSDSNIVKVNRALITYKDKYLDKTLAVNEFRLQDSLDWKQLKKGLEDLKATKDIDNEFSILLGTRIAYLDEQRTANTEYQQNFAALVLDSITPDSRKNFAIQDINTSYNGKMQNLTERIGRSIEDISASLSKKYDYAFSFSDFSMYGYYINLKKTKNQPLKPTVAPGISPADSSLPD